MLPIRQGHFSCWEGGTAEEFKHLNFDLLHVCDCFSLLGRVTGGVLKGGWSPSCHSVAKKCQTQTNDSDCFSWVLQKSSV